MQVDLSSPIFKIICQSGPILLNVAAQHDPWGLDIKMGSVLLTSEYVGSRGVTAF
jgi:hypothetical protein